MRSTITQSRGVHYSYSLYERGHPTGMAEPFRRRFDRYLVGRDQKDSNAGKWSERAKEAHGWSDNELFRNDKTYVIRTKAGQDASLEVGSLGSRIVMFAHKCWRIGAFVSEAPS